MKKTILKISLHLLLIVLSIILAILLIIKIKNTNIFNSSKPISSLSTSNSNNTSSSSNFSIYSDTINTLDNTEIKGLVESIENDYITIFEGRHEGELGLSIDGYTSAFIENKNQIYVDCMTGEEHDITYISKGDLLICTGTLITKSSSHYNGFDTKENKIMVFKKSDLDKIRKNAILDNLTHTSSIIIHSVGFERLYIQFDIEKVTNWGKKYVLSFVEPIYYTDASNISGQLVENNSIKNIELKVYDIDTPDIYLVSIELN